MWIKCSRSECVIKALESPTAVFVYMHFIEFTTHSALLMLALFSRGVWLSNRQRNLVLLRSFAVCVTVKNNQENLSGSCGCQFCFSPLTKASHFTFTKWGRKSASLHIKPNYANDDTKDQSNFVARVLLLTESMFWNCSANKKNKFMCYNFHFSLF